MKKIYLKTAGVINFITALVHLIAGQIDLVDPLIDSNISIQQKGEWIGVWHMVSIVLLLTSYELLREAFFTKEKLDTKLLKRIAIAYILFGIPFLISGFWTGRLIPQWILLVPVGILTMIQLRKNKI